MTEDGARAPQDNEGDDVETLIGDLCLMAAEMSGIASVTIVVSGRRNREGAVGHSDALAADTHGLEFTLGEGPTTDALSAAIPTLARNLDTALSWWPQFAPAAMKLGVASMSAVPLQIGAVRFGALTFYLDEQYVTGQFRVIPAFTAADAVVSALLDKAGQTDHGMPAGIMESTTYRAVVHQATGMIAAQTDSDMTDALLRLRAMAFARSETVEQVALAVISRQLRNES